MARPEAVAKRSSEGGRQISASFTGEEIKLLEDAKRALGTDVNKAALVEGLKAIVRGAPAPSAEQALDVLTELVRQRKPARARKRA